MTETTISATRKIVAPSWIPALAAALGVMAIVCLRRPTQLTDPAVWVEEGGQFFHQYLAHGPAYLFDPINGYMIFASKVVSFLALKTSFVHYPTASFFYCLLVSGLVGFAVAASPTLLRWRPICAIAVFLTPIVPEVFGVGSYTFWSAGLLAIVVILWRPGARGVGIRSALGVLSILSSPLGMLLLPLAALRAALLRSRSEIIVCVCLAAATGLQAAVILTAPQLNPADSFSAAILRSLTQWTTGVSLLQLAVMIIAIGAAVALSSLRRSDPLRVRLLMLGGLMMVAAASAAFADPTGAPAGLLARYFGGFFTFSYGNETLNQALGGAMIIGIIFYGLDGLWRRDWLAPMLVVCLFASIAASLLRMPVFSADPIQAGPRYYFYAYSVLFMIVIHLAAITPRWPKYAVLALVLAPLANAQPVLQRKHTPVDWSGIAMRCAEHSPAALDRIRPIPEGAKSNIALERNWLEGGFVSNGAHPSSPALTTGPSYGSGRESDAQKGAMRVNFVAPEGVRWVAIPALTGPDATQSKFWILGPNGDVLDYVTLANDVLRFQNWMDVALYLPASIEGQKVELVAADTGSGWGQWLAVGDSIRAIRSNDAPPSDYAFPVHTDGNISHLWKVSLTGDQCAKLAGEAALDGSYIKRAD